MDLFNLDRNFHNSFFETYYRLGPLCLLVFYFHFVLIFKGNRVHSHLPILLLALSFKALFDTFLFFTPIDLALFKLYGEEIFRLRRASLGAWYAKPSTRQLIRT